MRDKHQPSLLLPDAFVATADAFDEAMSVLEFKAVMVRAGFTLTQLNDSFGRLAIALDGVSEAWLAFHRAYRGPWYNRLRWRLDDWVRRHPRLSSSRSVRRFRLYVERLVAELNDYDLKERL